MKHLILWTPIIGCLHLINRIIKKDYSLYSLDELFIWLLYQSVCVVITIEIIKNLIMKC